MSRGERINVKQVSYHRNGVSGEGFFAVLFERGGGHLMVASVFDAPGAVAVYQVDFLSTVGVLFGDNSWRGDVFEPQLREAIAEYSAALLSK